MSHRTRNRVVMAVGIVLGLVGIVVIGWFAGLLLGSVAGSADDDTATGPTAGPSATSAAPTSAAPSSASGTPLKIVSATLFDPPPGDGQENPDRIALAYDGNPGTIWPTLQYNGSAAFGNLKPGVGLVFDLGSEQPLGSVKVTTTLPGSTVEIRTGPAGATTLDQYAVVSPGQTLTAETTFPVEAGTKARFVLVWITGLVPSNGTFEANLAEVAFTG